MIEINLLPEEIKKKKKRQAAKIEVSDINLQNIPILNIAAIAVAIILSIQLVLFVAGIMGGMSYDGLEKSYNEMLPKKLEAERLKTQVNSMSSKVAAIDELMVKRFIWARKLNALSEAMTPGIWLTGLDYNEKISEIQKPAKIDPMKKKPGGEAKPSTEKIVLRHLVLSGMASSMGEEGTALIGRFIKNLKSSSEFYSDFSDIELGTIKSDRADDQEVMEFQITCPFKIK